MYLNKERVIKMELLDKKINKKNIIILITLYLLIIGLLIVGYFYDYQITAKLAILNDGKYYSNNFFLRLLETIGEAPMYILAALSLSFIYYTTYDFKKKKLWFYLRLVMFVGLMVIYTYFTTRFFKYLGNHYKDGNGLYSNHKIIVYLFSFCFSLIPSFFTILLVGKIKKEYFKPLAFFGLIYLISIPFGPLVSEMIKHFITRMRYRGIYVLKQNGYNEYAVFNQFLHFEKLSLNDIMVNLKLNSDLFKSFPSGHSLAATLTIYLTFLPNFIIKEERKQKRISLILLIISIIYIIIIILSRILMGAHYLTDVIFGFMLGITSLLISYGLTKLFKNKLLKLYEEKNEE